MLQHFVRLASITRLASLIAIVCQSSLHASSVYSAFSRGMSAFRRLGPVSQRDVVSSLQCIQSDDNEANKRSKEGFTQKYDYRIKKAKKRHIKDISKLCVETFLGDGDDWLHINREKQNVARDLTKRLGGSHVSSLAIS